MNEQQAKNLRVLIRHMENDVNRTLYMSVVASGCGTPACAMGEACTVPAFVAMGYSLPRECSTVDVLKNGNRVPFTNVARELFGTEGRTLSRLFAADVNNAWKRCDVAPHEWAIEARKVLAENGYSMDTPDPFKRFMDKAMEPVSLEATTFHR